MTTWISSTHPCQMLTEVGSMAIMTAWSQEDGREPKKLELRWSGYYYVSSHNNIISPRHLLYVHFLAFHFYYISGGGKIFMDVYFIVIILIFHLL